MVTQCCISDAISYGPLDAFAAAMRGSFSRKKNGKAHRRRSSAEKDATAAAATRTSKGRRRSVTDYSSQQRRRKSQEKERQVVVPAEAKADASAVAGDGGNASSDSTVWVGRVPIDSANHPDTIAQEFTKIGKVLSVTVRKKEGVKSWALVSCTSRTG